MAKRILFIDRDGTIIKEPPTDYQVDSLEKLEFIPRAISALRKIALETDFKFVMVTNQDGLGTSSFPEKDFFPPQYKMLRTLEGEDIIFSEILVDRTFEHENASTRKPKTGLLTHYIDNPDIDLENSYVIGDRATDVMLARNLGAKAIQIAEQGEDDAALVTTDWDKIAAFLTKKNRRASIKRTTKETDIVIELNLDGSGAGQVSTGLHFFDHMLDQLIRHGQLDLNIQVRGDLHVDEHHTIEDTALALGEAFYKALGDKKGIYRYGFLLPMDDSLAQVAIDFGGRPWLVWDAEFTREKVGDMPTEMFYHFFKSFSDTARCNLNIRVEGDNEHHKIEAIFKAFAKAIKMAVQVDHNNPNQLPSTKGTL